MLHRWNSLKLNVQTKWQTFDSGFSKWTQKKNNRDYLHCRQSGNQQQHRTQPQHSSYNKMFTFHATLSLSLPFTRTLALQSQFTELLPLPLLCCCSFISLDFEYILCVHHTFCNHHITNVWMMFCGWSFFSFSLSRFFFPSYFLVVIRLRFQVFFLDRQTK